MGLNYNISVPGTMLCTAYNAPLTDTQLIYDVNFDQNQDDINSRFASNINTLTTFMQQYNAEHATFKISVSKPGPFYIPEQELSGENEQIIASSSMPCTRVVIQKGSTSNPTILYDSNDDENISIPITNSIIYTDSEIRDTTTYRAIFTYEIGGVELTVTKSATVTFSKPIYYGSYSLNGASNPNDAYTQSVSDSLTKDPIARTGIGNTPIYYNITTNQGDYVIIEVPNTWSINSINLYSTHTTAVGVELMSQCFRSGYKAYRTPERRQGTFTYQIV